MAPENGDGVSIYKLVTWFKENGNVHEVHSDPRGKYWVSGYAEEIYDMLEKEIWAGVKRKVAEGEVHKPDRSGATKPTGTTSKAKKPLKRKPQV